MASTANISAVTTANTFENWRIQTNLDTADINEVCRGDFYKPQGSINVAIGYIEISNVVGGFTALRIPYGDVTVSSGKLTVAKIDQIGATNFIYAAGNDIRFTNDALTFHAMGNTRNIRLFNNNFASLANVNATGWIETTGAHSNNGVILNVANFLTVANTVRLANVTISSNLAVSRNVTVSGNVSIGLRANVLNSLNVGSTLEATGNTSLYSNLAVTRSASIGANVTIGQNTSIGGNVSVGLSANVLGDMTIGGITTLQTFHVIDSLSNTNIGLAGTRAIYKFPVNTYRSGKVLIEVESSDGANTQLSEAVVTCNTTISHMTVYATVSTPPASSEGTSLIGTFSTAVVSGNAEIYITTLYNNCKTKVIADLIK